MDNTKFPTSNSQQEMSSVDNNEVKDIYNNLTEANSSLGRSHVDLAMGRNI